MAKARFVLDKAAVRQELLLSQGSVPVEEALMGMAQSVAPPGASVYARRTYGPGGRVVISIALDRWRRSSRTKLQSALAGIGGRFRKAS